jgi:Zn-dependent protease
VRRPENMSFISQDDSLLPLFYFYGGSVSRSIAPTRKQIYRAAVLASYSQRAFKAVALLLGARNFSVIYGPEN